MRDRDFVMIVNVSGVTKIYSCDHFKSILTNDSTSLDFGVHGPYLSYLYDQLTVASRFPIYFRKKRPFPRSSEITFSHVGLFGVGVVPPVCFEIYYERHTGLEVSFEWLVIVPSVTSFFGKYTFSCIFRRLSRTRPSLLRTKENFLLDRPFYGSPTTLPTTLWW